MKKAVALWLGLAVLAVPARSQTGIPDPELRSLVESERAFAGASLEKGMREAFLFYLADDAILFRPRPVPGKKWFLDRPAAPGVLSWKPIFADISAAGDLGYTTGPWEFRPDSADTQNVSYGDFISVWKKQLGGFWRVAVDLGTAHPRPEIASLPLSFGSPLSATRDPARRAADAEAERRALLGADRAFSKSCAARGQASAYGEFAADEIRFFRQGGLPILGKHALLAALPAPPGVLAWTPAAAEVSRSGDLGYSYGLGELKARGPGGPPPDSSAYVRIWRMDEKDRWRIVLDVTTRIPPAAAKSNP